MKERPILFSAPMVRALLDGTKTQTRRVVKPPGGYRWLDLAAGTMTNTGGHKMHRYDLTAPYGQPGDRLWVRETFYCDNAFYPNGVGVNCLWREVDGQRVAVPVEEQRAEMLAEDMYYRADGDPEFECPEGPTPWRPSIHMPRWASRIDLEITDVRMERLQDISESDAIAEGIERNWSGELSIGPNGYGSEGWVPDCGWRHYLNSMDGDPAYTPEESYRSLWDSINEASRPVLPANPDSKRYARVKARLEKHPDTSSWDSNPWVWVVSFRRIRK